MPPKVPVVKLTGITRPVQRQRLCQRGNATMRQSTPFSHTRCVSTSIPKHGEMEINRQDRPRWQFTPQDMRAPLRSRPKPLNNEFRVNEDPRRLDQMYTQFLGSGGDKMLTEEVKWLAITHKSFDHGRRGFNDRLAFLGTLEVAKAVVSTWREMADAGNALGIRLVDVQTSLAIIHSASSQPLPPTADRLERVPFQHPALNGLTNLTAKTKTLSTDQGRLSQLAQQYGLGSVVRWKPKKADNLVGSGLDMVLMQALYAIIGAITLQKGGETAIKVVRERILHPLGLS
ncbi:MAG: hypothetical protein M1830_002583 [Pleopsidium flavum]|nr:MAG: hypothetical protein M1830_002583 [Pleopsidium flavum]